MTKTKATRLPSTVDRPSHRWGLESWLDCWAWILLAIGLFVTLFGTLFGLSLISWRAVEHARGEGRTLVILAAMLQMILGVATSIAVFLLFRWTAETLRLLKKLSCLEFSGQVSDSRREPNSLWICSACQNLTYATRTCENCGATFE
ncbi:MAG: hypothetical protein Q8M16_10860 [Pirellulaceae bacterium]|nr:hypothetical protein [Pirellulaceae bacterium]